jgi:hypothetical protein
MHFDSLYGSRSAGRFGLRRFKVALEVKLEVKLEVVVGAYGLKSTLLLHSAALCWYHILAKRFLPNVRLFLCRSSLSS